MPTNVLVQATPEVPNVELCGGPSGPSERAPGSALTDKGN
jgi:hypothetical protein